MDLPFRRTAYLNGKQPSEDIDRTKLLALPLRTMGVGSCSDFLFAGNVKAPCHCKQGVLTFQLGATLQGNENCRECTHPLSAHGNFNQPEIQLPFENSPDICRRTDTVQKIAELLAEKGVVHVRGTPSSGKTTLALLLKGYYTKRKEAVVFVNGWHNVGDPTAYLIS